MPMYACETIHDLTTSDFPGKSALVVRDPTEDNTTRTIAAIVIEAVYLTNISSF